MSFNCERALKIVTDTANSKGGKYKKEPVEFLPISKIITQVMIKAVRADEAISVEKQKDELKDVAVYAIKALQRLINEETNDTAQTSILDYTSTCSTTQIHLMEPGTT